MRRVEGEKISIAPSWYFDITASRPLKLFTKALPPKVTRELDEQAQLEFWARSCGTEVKLVKTISSK